MKKILTEICKDKTRKLIEFWKDKSKNGHKKQLIIIMAIALALAVFFANFPDLWNDPNSNDRFRSASSGIYASFFGSLLAMWFVRKYASFIQKCINKLKLAMFLGLVALAPIMGYAATFATDDAWVQWSVFLSLGFSSFISLYLTICDKLMTEDEEAVAKEAKSQKPRSKRRKGRRKR